MPATLKYTEHELVELLKKHDQNAIVFLYDSYSPALYGIILKIVSSQEVAQEVMQDVFVKAWEKISSYDKKKGKLFTWLLNIAKNSAIDVLRSRQFKAASKIQPLEQSVNEVNRKSATPNMEYIGLESVVKKLKDEQRTLIDLVYFKGYTHDEASKELNMPLGTVKTRIRSAVSRLREIIT